MAGVTSEARAASERLPDRISIGVLARTFPAGLLDEVIDAAGVREVRFRLLPARLMMVFTLACWSSMRSGYGLVLAKLTDAQALAPRGWGSWQAPSTGSITKAKARLVVGTVQAAVRPCRRPDRRPRTHGGVLRRAARAHH